MCGIETAPVEAGGRTPREQRIIAGFEEIERFVEEHGRLPKHGENRDIFERLYAVRLDRLRELQECREVLNGLDSRGLLGETPRVISEDEPDDAELLASLGVDASAENEVTKLTHVRSRDEINAAEEIAKRAPCQDFADFKPIFEQVQRELDNKIRRTFKYQDNAKVEQGDLFILDGQKLLVAQLGEKYVTEFSRHHDRRLRIIYDNGTESEPLLRSLQRSLNRDKASRRISKPGLGPLFDNVEEEDDVESGTIYILRSKSDHPFVAEHRTVLHKIGVTGGEVKSRIANAKKDPTYLLADVETVATFKLANIDRKRLEALLHKFFTSARLDLELKDRFGFQVAPEEWYLVPLPAIEQAIEKLIEGTIGDYAYDPTSASIVKRTK